jgi:demethylmenaquinone methyltransferase/2-methoxy-6-polyprenyl-1,4-benzoquinol methylase
MKLPLADNSVDAVTISFGVRNFEDRQKGLREILRVLRPGGRLFVLEFSQPDPWFRPFYYIYLKYILPWVAAIATGDKSAYDYLAGTIENFPTKRALAEQLQLAGYDSVKATGLTFSIVAIHEANKADNL